MDAEKCTEEEERRRELSLKDITFLIIEQVHRLQRARGIFYSLGIAITCTALNILTYIAGETMHPTNVIFWTSVTMASLSVVALIFTRPNFPHTVKTVSYIVLGSSFTGCGSVFLLVGIIMSEPANAVSLYFTLPVILIILEAIIKKHTPKIMHLIFTICSIIGVFLVAKPSFIFEQSSHNHIWGILCGLLCAFSHAGTFTTFREIADSHIHPFILSVCSAVSIMAISFSLCTFLEGVKFPPDVDMLLLIAATGASHFIAYNFVFLALAAERPFIVSIIMTFEVTFTFIAQWLILNMAPSWHSAIGGCLISVACIGVALTKIEGDIDDYEQEERHILSE